MQPRTLVAALAVLSGVSSYAVGTGVQANPSGCNVCGQNPPIQGNWGEWGPWSSCNTQYGSPAQTRQRVCSASSCAGGSSTESRPCVQYDPQPQWSAWQSWGQCSATCGGGQCTRTRVCNNGCSSCQCVGSNVETTVCNAQPCCNWSQWSGWSQCSVTCGNGGYQSRTRQCSCVSGCVGTSNEQQECNASIPCPVPVCDTCQPHYEPPTCNTCNTPAPLPPLPCQTCNQPPPPCQTCGQPQPYYNPYGNKKRSITNNNNNNNNNNNGTRV